jgi:hypothetical protein
LKGQLGDVRAELEEAKAETEGILESMASLRDVVEFTNKKLFHHELDIENLKGIVTAVQQRDLEREGRVQVLEQKLAVRNMTLVETLGLVFRALDDVENALIEVFWPQGKIEGKVYGDPLATVPHKKIEFTGDGNHEVQPISLHDDELAGDTDVESVGEVQLANVHRGDEAAQGDKQSHLVKESKSTPYAVSVGIHRLGRQGGQANGGAAGGWCTVM